MPEHTPLRLQLIDRFQRILRAMPSVRAVEYDLPFDFDLPAEKMPHVWIYDFDEAYNLSDMNGQSSNTLKALTVLSYKYTEDRERSLLRRGNGLLAELLKAVMADHTLGGLAFLVQPLRSTIQDIADKSPLLGALGVEWEIQYYMPLSNPYGQR